MPDYDIIGMLRDEYVSSVDEKSAKRSEIKRKHQEIARKNAAMEIEAMEDAVDAKLAGLLVRALSSGVKRSEIWKPVFGNNDNGRWSRLIKLGGGETRAKRTGAEITRQKFEELGVRHVADNRYIWTVDEVEFEADLLWQRGKPVLFPVGDAVVTLRDNHGVNSADLVTKGAEVAAAFDISEPN